MRVPFLIALSFAILANSNAQIIERASVNSSGNQVSANGIILTQSVGQVIAGIKSNGISLITEGFQQADSAIINHVLNENDLSLLLFPNPTRDQFMIAGLMSNSKINIFDQTGRLVNSYVFNQSPISLKEWASGQYLICVESEDKRIWSARLIKE